MFLSKHVKYPKGVQIQNIKDILEKSENSEDILEDFKKTSWTNRAHLAGLILTRPTPLRASYSPSNQKKSPGIKKLTNLIWF